MPQAKCVEAIEVSRKCAEDTNPKKVRFTKDSGDGSGLNINPKKVMFIKDSFDGSGLNTSDNPKKVRFIKDSCDGSGLNTSENSKDSHP